ncbi:MAG: hypothetical protein ACI936_002534 [Paraglaciecola sp.]|jgi:hypothetical protein
MNKYVNTILSIVTTSTFLVGCSNINNYEQDINNFIADQNLSAIEKIDSLLAYDFIVLNDQHIALIKQNNKSYLLTTPDNCQNMNFANKVILLAAEKGVVRVNSDKVARVGDKYTECIITGIYKLYSVQLQELVHLYRHQKPMQSGRSNAALSNLKY